MRDVLFVLGAPGVGKTTVVRELLGECAPLLNAPVKVTVGENALAAGHYTGGTFDGADTVPYNGAYGWLSYWYANLLDKISQSDLTIFDGDRFSNSSTLEFLKGVDVRVLGVHLYASDEHLMKRRAKRGSNQNESWMRGRKTKALNFAAKIGAASIDANTCDTMSIVDDIYKHIDRSILWAV